MLFLAQAGHCLTFAAHHTATVAWLRTRLNHSLVVRGQAMYVTIAYGLGGTTGTFAGKLAWSAWGASSVFALAGIAGAAAFVLSFWFLPATQPKQRGSQHAAESVR
ncbi:MAG: MFS transporter [Limnobacter sp.]|nr:MFS transporter [Limnobacter sp.]